MSNELLFEIGTEEIPAGFLSKAVGDMEDIIRKSLTEKRIPFAGIKCMATPRRLVLYIAEVAPKQEDQTIEKMGPAKKAAFDENGNPTKAALGFARGQGMEICRSGNHCHRKRRISGRTQDHCRTADGSSSTGNSDQFPYWLYPFRKSMRWADYDLRFARPIHWLLALYDGNVVPLKIEDIDSGNTSCGHQVHEPGSLCCFRF